MDVIAKRSLAVIVQLLRGVMGRRQTELRRVSKKLNGHEFEQTPGDNEGQGSLACYSSWGCRVRKVLETEQQVKNSGVKVKEKKTGVVSKGKN